MLARAPDIAQVFQFQNGKIHALSTRWDTVSVHAASVPSGYVAVGSGRGGTVYRALPTPPPLTVVPWDLFKKNPYSYLLPNTYSDVLVRDYATGTGPDILARVERLDRKYDSTNAQSGINRNGIYFYTALNDVGDSLSVAQPPMWNPSAYGYSAQRGQALQLFQRLDTVLTHHYGGRTAWSGDSTKKIDIVCHSQGCLDTRDMLRNVRDATLANPLNHIRKVVSLDSPAFGSAMATSALDLQSSPEFSSLDSIRNKLLDTAGQLVGDHDNNLEFVAGMAAATAYQTCSSVIGIPGDAQVYGGYCALVGGVWTEVGGILAAGGVEAVNGYSSCSDAVGVPVAAQIAGGGCALVTGALGAIAAPFTNFVWSLHGGLVGPYDVRVRTNSFGFTTITHFNVQGPKSLRKMVVQFADTTRHLSHTSPWITQLANFGYPTRPLDGAPIPFTVLYSGGTGHLVDTLSQKLRENLNQYCADHEDDITDNCDLIDNGLEGILGTTKVANDPDVRKIESLVEKLQIQWTDTGDLIVEKASQLMVNPTFGFVPKVGLFDTLNYRFQVANALGGAKYVAHLPIKENDTFDVNGTKMNFNLFRPGAPRMGMDIYAALGYDTLVFSQGVQALPHQGGSVTLPPLNPAVGISTLAVVQQLPVQGGFDVEPVSADSLLQGIVLRTDSTGAPMVLAVWDRTQGVFLWARLPDGTQVTKVLGHIGRPVQVRLTRHGSTFVMTATGLDGGVNADSVSLTLPDQLWLGALSTPAVAASDSLRPVLVGQITVTDSSALAVERPWNLLVLERESADSTQSAQALPRIVLVNRDARSVHGVTLYYEFRADPSRNPQLQSFQGPGNATLENLGGDAWRVRILDPSAVVLPGTVYPNANGFGFQLNYSDWTVWPRKAEWSSQGGSALLYSTNRIQVRDGSGTVLAGLEMPPTDSGRREGATGMARDEGLGSNNAVAPVLAVYNGGGSPLLGYHVQWFVRAPVGTTVALESWYTPDAQASIKTLGSGLWVIDLAFGAHILYPGQTTPEQKIGIHIFDWSPWDRTGNPTQTSAAQGLVPVEGMVVLDSLGNILWGNLPSYPDTAAVVPPPAGGDVLPVSVQIRDENPWDNSWIRPRMILTNQGGTTLTRFAIALPLVADNSKQIQVAPWYIPGCQVGLVPSGANGDTLRYVCQNLSVPPGGIWPDLGGAVVGVQYVDGTPWNRAADPFVSGWTVNFAPTTDVKVEALP